MADKRCFVQLPHPGGEHNPDRDGGKDWHGLEQPHMRKFMQLRRAQWIDEDCNRQTGDLHAWGEWEPESGFVTTLTPPDGDSLHPRYLWRPYYVPKKCYRGLHNTDPFIFGERILYSNCRQKQPGLRHLAKGSVIAFGSCKKVDGKWRWMLDTVLVVRDFKNYDASSARIALRDWVSATFQKVTGGPLADNAECRSQGCAASTGAATPFRLYRGATPDDPVAGMFSFFPAIPARGDSTFPRPLVDLPAEYFTPSLCMTAKIRRDCTSSELRGLWDSLVTQVREAGLVLGTHAEVPPRRDD